MFMYHINVKYIQSILTDDIVRVFSGNCAFPERINKIENKK